MLQNPSKFASVLLLVGSLAMTVEGVHACTTILVGKEATEDGSVLMATSCDGNMMGRIYVLPAKEYRKGAEVEMFYNFPAPATWQEHLDEVEKGNTFVGRLPIERTYRCVLAAGHFADSVTGGINEHGVSMGIEYMGMNPELVNRKGIVSTCSNHWSTSLIANGLMRATTAREAIRLMGSMAEKYGFTYGKTPPFSREEVIPGVVFFTSFHETAVSLKDGEIGTPIFSSPDKGAGYILRKTGHVPPRPMKFEEVRDKIKSRIQDEKKMREAEKIADKVSGRLSSGDETLENIAEEMDLEINATGTVSVNDYIENVGPAGIVVLTAQETGEGGVMPPVPVKKGVLIGRVEKIVRASEKKFEKEKAALRQEILTNKQMQVMDNWFKQNRTKTKLNKPLDEL